MTAWKLRGEMGHGTEKMIEQRSGRYVADEFWNIGVGVGRSPRRPSYANLAGLLTEGQRRTLKALSRHPEGLATNAWMAATGDQPGTFILRRVVLGQLGLVHRVGKRGSPWLLTADSAGY